MLAYGSKTLDITSDWFWEIFEGDSTDMCTGNNSTHVDGGPMEGSGVLRPRSEDPHRREQKFLDFWTWKPMLCFRYLAVDLITFSKYSVARLVNKYSFTHD